MAWQIDDILLAKLAIVASAGIASTLVAVGRVCLVHSRRRVFLGWRRFVFGLAGAALLACAGGVLATGMLVETLSGSPFAAWSCGSLVGVGCDLATASGPMRAVELALALLGRMADSARQSIGSRDKKPPTDSTLDE